MKSVKVLVLEALEMAELELLPRIAIDFEQAQTHIKEIDLGGACPKVILLDLNLPKGSGLELLQMFYSSPKLQSVPAIVVRSSSAPRDKDRAAKLGATLLLKANRDGRIYETRPDCNRVATESA